MGTFMNTGSAVSQYVCACVCLCVIAILESRCWNSAILKGLNSVRNLISKRSWEIASTHTELKFKNHPHILSLSHTHTQHWPYALGIWIPEFLKYARKKTTEGAHRGRMVGANARDALGQPGHFRGEPLIGSRSRDQVGCFMESDFQRIETQKAR